jgi:hypothetical protein
MIFEQFSHTCEPNESQTKVLLTRLLKASYNATRLYSQYGVDHGQQFLFPIQGVLQ